MGVLRLGICVGGVYSTFLLWAIAQERLSKPFPSTHPHPTIGPNDKFPSALFLNFAQAIASCLSAITYLLVNSWRDGSLGQKGLKGVLGITQLLDTEVKANGVVDMKENGHGNGNGHNRTASPVKANTEKSIRTDKSLRERLPFLLLQVSAFQTMAGPIGFSALRHISYPTMVLGKSCKLIPVLLLNVLLYRRRFSPHKYLVVSLVTIGISMFMFFGPAKKKGGEDSFWGLGLLLVNLLIDGLTNSTQDQIFTKYPKFTGQQMMFAMSSFTILLLLPTMILPLPTHPLALLHIPFTSSDRTLPSLLDLSPPPILAVISFITTHPTSLAPLVAYALLGGLGQLFIFETIQHFGSLTLVMVTVTRKLFTMLLSVIVFNHTLTSGQWMGVGVVFGGIGVEAGMKRREMMKRTKRD